MDRVDYAPVLGVRPHYSTSVDAVAGSENVQRDSLAVVVDDNAQKKSLSLHRCSPGVSREYLAKATALAG